MEVEYKYDLVKFVDRELELEISVSSYDEKIWVSVN